MDILLLIIGYGFATGITAVLLWVAMRIVRVEGAFGLLLLASAISTLVGLIPVAGNMLSFLVLLVLLYKWTDMDNWLYALLMTAIARGLSLVLLLVLLRTFA